MPFKSSDSKIGKSQINQTVNQKKINFAAIEMPQYTFNADSINEPLKTTRFNAVLCDNCFSAAALATPMSVSKMPK